MRVKLNFHDSESTVNTDITLETTTQNQVELIPIGKSGIHIKKKNRGSFTSYCGGKVTDECIRKAKNSPSVAIRKKAVFAQNARGWAKKHQAGGTLNHLPGIASTGIASSFVDLDTSIPSYAANHPDQFLSTTPSLISDIDFQEQTTPTKDLEITEEVPETPGASSWLTTPYQGTAVIPGSGSGSFGAGASASLISSVNKFLGIPYMLGGKGPEHGQGLDCSGFVSRVIGSMGYNLKGNCRTLWSGTAKINLNDVKPGDLIFLKGTQPKSGLKPEEASHVAIVTDTSKLSEGKIGVAHSGRTGTNSNMTEWNLNNGYYSKHLLGAGRLIQNAKFGGKLDYSDAHE